MSGVKVSNYALERETAQRVERQGELQTRQRQLNGLHTHLDGMLAAASAGLQRTFAVQVAEAQVWLAQTAALTRSVDTGSLSALEAAVAQERSSIARGQAIMQNLSNALNEQADAMGRELANRLATFEVEWHARRELLQQWRKPEEVEHWVKTITNLKRLFGEQAYRDMEMALSLAISNFASEVSEVEVLEAKHQKRLYLLDALQRVCKSMGFQEIQPSISENPEQRGSRIIYQVDTLDRGKINFYLSLDNISSGSNLGTEYCFEEFDKLSLQLQEKFGVMTHFEPEQGKRPIKIEKNEKTEPVKGSRSQEKHK